MPTLTPLDRLITLADTFLKTTSGSIGARNRPSPAGLVPQNQLSKEDRQYSARLMRINHCGEVCEQALYNGQALTAVNRQTIAVMKKAADEETDHLAWCEQRIKQLDSHVSYLNPFWYAASFSMGAVTGLLGDKINLGFVAATEQEVCRHIDEHLDKLVDTKSIAVLTQMRIDEENHAATALAHGGANFPRGVLSVQPNALQLLTNQCTLLTILYR